MKLEGKFYRIGARPVTLLDKSATKEDQINKMSEAEMRMLQMDVSKTRKDKIRNKKVHEKGRSDNDKRTTEKKTCHIQ